MVSPLAVILARFAPDKVASSPVGEAEASGDSSPSPGGPALPARYFDQAEADALLVHLTAELRRVEATYPGGRFPEVRRRAINLIVETCRSYVDDRDWWETRNCDPLESLRRAVPFWLEWARRPA